MRALASISLALIPFIARYSALPLQSHTIRSIGKRMYAASPSPVEATAKPTVDEYLQSLKKHFEGANARSSCAVHVVVGNEAADADSIVSSICYAYFKQYIKPDGNVCEAEPVLYVPAACIRRTDIHFRREVRLLLEAVGMSLDDLICEEELQLQDYHAVGKLELTLVDHNSLQASFADFADCVVEILDHHKDAGNHLVALPAGSDKRRIAFDADARKPTAGSCCTLVAEQIAGSEGGDQVAALMRDNPRAAEQLCTLLLSVIALDTINMNPDAAIGTDRDNRMLQALGACVVRGHTRDSLYDMIRGAKTDAAFWAELSARDVLRIDYKSFSSPTTQLPGAVGISSAMMPIGKFLEKPLLGETLAQWMDEEKLALQVVMCLITAPELRRELLLVSRDAAVVSGAERYLQDAMGNYDLRPLPAEQQRLLEAALPAAEGWCGRVFQQGNVKASRKAMAPDLLHFAEYY